MSEQGQTTGGARLIGPDLTDADVDRALGRTLDRGRHLVQRRGQRRAAVGVVTVAALLVGGFGVIRSLSDDARVVVSPAGLGTPDASTSTTAPLVAPPGFTRTELGGGVVRLDNTAPRPGTFLTTTSHPAGTPVVSSSMTNRAPSIVGVVRRDAHVARVSFGCDPSTGYVSSVTYRREGSNLKVQVYLFGENGTPGCDPVETVDLYFPGEVLPEKLTAETWDFG